MKRFLLPVVLILLTSCFGAGNLCAQGGGKIVKAVTKTVVKSGTKATEQAFKKASAQAAKASYINIVVRGQTFKLPENYKTLSNGDFATKFFTQAKKNLPPEQIKALSISQGTGSKEGRRLLQEVKDTLEALSTLLHHPEIVVAYSHKMPFMPTGGVINGKLSPAQRLEQLNKAIDYAIKNPQEVIKADPNAPAKTHRTREERLVQAVIFTRVYGRWFSKKAGVDALITKDEEHNFYKGCSNIKQQTKDDEISNAITKLMDDYAVNKSPEYWLAQLEIFVKRYHRLPKDYSQVKNRKFTPEKEEETRLICNCRLVARRNPNNEAAQKIRKILDDYAVQSSPSEVLAAFYNWLDTLEANGKPLHLPSQNTHIKEEELTDPQRAEKLLRNAMDRVQKAFNAGRIKDPKQLKAAEEIVKILSNPEYRRRARPKTIGELYQDALMFFKTTSSYHSTDKAQHSLYYIIVKRLYSPVTKTSAVKKLADYEEEFSRTGVATPDPKDTRFVLNTDEGRALYRLLQLDQLARACARGENPAIFSWDIFDYEDPLAELAKRIASQQEAVAAQVAAPVKEIKLFSYDEAAPLWNAFPAWFKENKTYATNNATSVALKAVKNIVETKGHEIAAHSRTTNIIDELLTMTEWPNTLGYNNGKFYKILFRGENPQQPQPGNFYHVAEEFGVPENIVPNTELTTSWDWENSKLKSIILKSGVTKKEIEALFNDIKENMGGEIRMGMHELDVQYVNGNKHTLGEDGRKGQIHVHFEKFALAEDGPSKGTSYTLQIDASALIEGAANDNVIFNIYKNLFGSYINLFR